MAAVEHMFEGSPIPVDYDLVPKCVYTYPEVASIGKNLEQAKAQNIKARAYKIPFKAIGKAMIDDIGEQKAFVK